MFDFSKALSEAQNDERNTTLMGLVLSPSGGGKSSLAGTFEGSVLFIHTEAEGHGIDSAKAMARKTHKAVIIPACISETDGKKLSGDESYNKLLYILSNIPDTISAVVLDSMTEIEEVIRRSGKFKTLCINDKGKHSAFEEPKAVMVLMRPVLDSLRDLRKRKIHVLATCILDVSQISDEGDILESKPRLSTYSVAEGIIQQFPTVFTVGCMTKNDKQAYRIQFLSGVSRSSKDTAGIIKKTINYRPRIAGVVDLPETIKADVTEIIKLMKGEKSA
jgi:hypothetical protein